MSKDKGKGKVNIERWLGIITVAISIIALFFSWQSNRLSSQQATAQVVVLDATWNGSDYHEIGNGQAASCQHIFRLSNLGGVSTALTSFKVKISFRQSELTFENSFAHMVKPDELTPQIHYFEIFLYSGDNAPTLFNSEGELELPYKIEPYSTFDIQTAIIFMYRSELTFESPRYNEQKSFWYNPSMLEGYTPMMLSYTFKTAAGQEINSPSVTCWYIK